MIAMILFLSIQFLSYLSFFDSIENLTYDLRLMWSSVVKQDSDIVIVAIDDKSLEELGRWPWERNLHTQLLEKLAVAEPRNVVFDIMFSESSPDPKEDEALAKAMQKFKASQVILPEYAQFNSTSEDGKLQVENRVVPIDALKGFPTGHINVIPDPDGVVRKGLYSYTFEGETIPSLDELAVESYSGFEIDENKIPFNFLKQWYIPYIKGYSFPIYSYADVLNGRVPDEELQDKLILIGPMSVGLSDHYATPVQNLMYGVEIHAHAINALMHDQFMQPMGADWLWILGFILIGLWFAHYFSMRLGIVFVLSITVIYSFLSLYVLENYFVVTTVVAPLTALVLSYALNIGINYYIERLERQQVTRLFGRFVAPQVVDEILRLGEAGIKLGGTRKYISVLFLDVRGFTPLSEKMQPEEIVDVLNSFFDDITKSIFEHGGTLDKFIGDAVMAIFNAPLELENHEVQAVRTAIQIQRRAQAIQRRLEEKYGRTVAFGIGINCGDAVVGNIGAMERLDYTAIGDTVNLAARLESNSQPNQIIISQRVYEQVIAAGANDIRMTYMGAINVKGKSEPVEIYEVHHQEENQEQQAVVNS